MLMTTIFLFLFSISFIHADYAGVDDDCAKFCNTSYPVYEQAKSCKEGCKEFYMQSYQNEKCADSCVTTYVPWDLASPCIAGCKNQTLKSSVSISFDQSSPFFSKVSNVFSGMINSVKNIFNNDDLTMNRDNIFSNDNGISNMVQRMNERFKAISESLQESFDDFSPSPFAVTEKPLLTVGNRDENGEPILEVQMLPIEGQVDHELDAYTPEVRQYWKSRERNIVIEDDGWSSCLRRRIQHLSMITRWMLCVALMLSMVSITWICFAILRTAPRRHMEYLTPVGKGVDNVYYATPPFTVSDKSPMIIQTNDYKAQPGLEAPPPTYEAVTEKKE